MSLRGSRRRLGPGLLELIPQLLFYCAQTVIVFALFKEIDGRRIPTLDLTIFMLIVGCVDSAGDALIFKGLGEYASALRRGQCTYYLLAPGAALAKVLALRWDLPMLLLAGASGAAAVVVSVAAHGSDGLWLLPLLPLGVLAHIVLTASFHLVQAWYDPTMPLAFGNPAARLYTKPLHLILHGSVAAWMLTAIYPAYLITALPAAVATSGWGGASERVEAWPLLVGCVCLMLLGLLLDRLVVHTCRRRQA